ncbi:MAG: serine hydrolase [Cyclobacteriaceae bacterium]
MSKLIFFFLVIPFLSFGQFHKIDSESITALEEIIENQKTVEKIVGLSVGVIKDGEIVYLKGFGYQDLGNKIPSDEHTTYRMASVSKTITGLLAMILMNEGELDLKTDIRNYVPEYPSKSPGIITTEDLLSHESGIIHYSGTNSGQFCSEDFNLNAIVEYGNTFQDRYDPISALNSFKDQKICFSPGQHYQYTTWGYCLLGAVLERAGKDHFENLLYRKLVLPFKLPYLQPEFQAFRPYPHETLGYAFDTDGNIIPTPPEWIDSKDISYKIPGGGLISSVIDLTLIMKGISNDEILSRENVDLYGKINVPLDGKTGDYGFGVYSSTRNGHRIFSHSGSQANAATLIYFSPDRGNGVAIMANTRGASLWSMARQIFDHSFDLNVIDGEPFIIPDRKIVKIVSERSSESCDGIEVPGILKSGLYLEKLKDDSGRQFLGIINLTTECISEPLNIRSKPKILITPNPSYGKFRINFQGRNSSGAFKIFNISGTILDEGKFYNSTGIELRVEQEGTLIIQLEIGGTKSLVKVVNYN